MENICQGVCRDLLAYSILNCKKQGLKAVLHVHDELVVEVDDTKGPADLKWYEDLISETPAWAKGFPVQSAGWIGTRYRKD